MVELASSEEVGLVLGNRQILRVARKDIDLNEQNMRWECEAKNARGDKAAETVTHPTQTSGLLM